ncbi:hypothetical protein L3V64_000395 [Geobacillus stearothermophilus]|uniref:hypothetical protein n=1 Tax=Geobacillus stearothermophilus TaxID=1422 RepID=UPI001F209A78|nr:hypothetical protein [Geobacillus stearothermophilus]MCK7604915.1 hypothetical protein [Geobacillus stearothermophilus]WJQ01187.1 hypothetical protein QT234_04915 [Geobacillus stearothermophilus]
MNIGLAILLIIIIILLSMFLIPLKKNKPNLFKMGLTFIGILIIVVFLLVTGIYDPYADHIPSKK